MNWRDSRRSPSAAFGFAFLRHLARFLLVEAASGIVLPTSAIAALIWANPSFAHLHESL